MIWLLLCFYVYLSSSLTETQGPPVSLALALSKARTTGVGNVTSLYKHRREQAIFCVGPLAAYLAEGSPRTSVLLTFCEGL